MSDLRRLAVSIRGAENRIQGYWSKRNKSRSLREKLKYEVERLRGLRANRDAIKRERGNQ